MIETNTLVSLIFSDLPETPPTTWDLSSYIPNGALDASQVQVRIRPVGEYWQAWDAVTAFDNATNIATYTVMLPSTQVEFRRNTPRYAIYLDPNAPSSRVSQRNLQVNADQGLFVATEWAAQYGFNVYQTLLPDPATAQNTLGLVQQTQNHWASTANWGNTSWNFQFAGGYIDRTHVRAQVLLAAGWTAVDIDASDPHADSEDAPVTAPFRFIGDYTLFMDFSTLGEVPQGLIIYRYTPRNVHISSPTDGNRITAAGMEPSAQWAFFAAVEIGEELAKRVPPCECEQYFTSLLYPLFYPDTLSISIPQIEDAEALSIYFDNISLTVPSLMGVVLTGTLNLLDYLNWRDVTPDTMTAYVPTITAGTLVDLPAVELDYTNWRDVNSDVMHLAVPRVTAGVIVVTLNFINYVNWRDVNFDNMHLPVPTITAGSLV